MNTETNQEVDLALEAEGGEGESQADVVTIPKADWEKTQQTLGSYKRELKDLRKAKEEPKETPTQNQSKPDESALSQKLERLALRQAGIDHPEDIELARKTAEKWKVDIDEVLADEDFKVKLEKQQTSRANVLATSGVKGSTGSGQAKLTPEYWVSKGTHPTATDVPDRKVRAQIARALMGATKSGKKFYNE